jgi:hypothetical protein
VSEEKIINNKINKVIVELNLESQKKNIMAPEIIKITKRIGYELT